MNNEWLKNLEVGDQVVIAGCRGDSISTVERLTKTLIITKKNRKFRKDGSEPGNRFSRGILVEPSPERVNTIRQANLAHILSHYDWKKLSYAKLREVWDTLPKEDKK